MVIYILLTTLIIEFIISYIVFKKIIVSPSCVLSAVFIVATIDLIRNIDYWSVELHWNTYSVIAGGVLVFMIVAFAADIFYRGTHHIRTNDNSIDFISPIDIEKWKLYGFVIFNFMTFYLVFFNIRKNAIALGASENLTDIISVYRYANLTVNSNAIALPSYVNMMNLMMLASGPIWIYLLINNFLASKKIHKIAILNISIILLNYFVTGSRGKMINLVLSGIPMFFFLWCSKNKKIRRLKSSYLIKIIIILLFLAFSFRAVANLMGRTIALDTMEHLSVNLSAPMLNLNNFLQEEWKAPDLWGYNTFGYLTNTLGRKLRIESWIHTLDLPFKYINNRSLGNIYTTFYAYYYDFKYAGVIVLSALMGFISQITYVSCIRNVFQKKAIRYSLIVYADIFMAIAFSFDSNKFYERVATISYLETLVCWWLIIIFFEKIRIHRKPCYKKVRK